MQDDKKKMMVLGVLGVVLVGIGAFTMIPQEGPPPPSTASGWKPPVEGTETATSAEEQEPAKNPSVVALLDRRDPFDVPDNMEEKRPEASSQEVPPPPTPRASSRRSRENWRPSGMRNMPDFDFQLPGARNEVEVRPATPPTEAINDATSNPGAVTPPKDPEPTFDYGVNGVILGRRPAAVLTDKQGNQKLVVMGGAIDGDATLVDVRPGAVIVSFRGKRLRVEMKGDKDAN